MEPIRVLATLDSGVDPEIVETLLSIEPTVQIIGVAESTEADFDSVAEQSADLLVVACATQSDRVLSFIGRAVKQHPEQPVVVLSSDAANGFVRRAFEAGADDIVTIGRNGASNGSLRDEILFTLQKTIARRRGMKDGAGRSARDRLICVLGPKGGIGKTLTASNLAVALASQGSSAVIVDIDLQFGDVALALGIEPQRTLYDLATSSGGLDDEKLAAYLAEHDSGARVLLAPTRPDQAGAITAEFLREVYSVLRGAYDYVIVDTPPGFTSEVIASVDAASDYVMVGMLDSLSLKNTKLGLETLGLMGIDADRVKVVLNRADSRVGITKEDVAEVVGRPPDVMIPSHRDIARLVNEGRTVIEASPRSEAARAFNSLARMFSDVPASTPAPARRARAPRRRPLLRRKG